MERRLGDGSDTDFWDGNWIGGPSLKSLFPRLFHLSTKQNAKVKEIGERVQGEWRWKVVWRRALRDSEEAGVAEMMHLIQNFQPMEGRAD